MSETNFAAKAALLKAAAGQAGVRSLARELRVGPATIIRLREQMFEEGLIEVSEEAASGPGRPREKIGTTALGREYLRAYEALRSKGLRSRESDLLRAASDGRYAGRLASRGVSTVALFLELTSLAKRTR